MHCDRKNVYKVEGSVNVGTAVCCPRLLSASFLPSSSCWLLLHLNLCFSDISGKGCGDRISGDNKGMALGVSLEEKGLLVHEAVVAT